MPVGLGNGGSKYAYTDGRVVKEESFILSVKPVQNFLFSSIS